MNAVNIAAHAIKLAEKFHMETKFLQFLAGRLEEYESKERGSKYFVEFKQMGLKLMLLIKRFYFDQNKITEVR